VEFLLDCGSAISGSGILRGSAIQELDRSGGRRIEFRNSMCISTQSFDVQISDCTPQCRRLWREASTRRLILHLVTSSGSRPLGLSFGRT
jgi:hypothetical protein